MKRYVCLSAFCESRERERERNKTRVFFADFIRTAGVVCVSFWDFFFFLLFPFFCDRKKERYFEIHIKREYVHRV